MGTSCIAYDISGMYTCQMRPVGLPTARNLFRPARESRQRWWTGLHGAKSIMRVLGVVVTAVIYLAFGNLHLYTRLSTS